MSAGRFITSVALAFALAGPVQAVTASPANAQGWHGAGWNARGWDRRGGRHWRYDRRRGNDTGLIVGLGALAAVAVIAAAAADKDRDRPYDRDYDRAEEDRASADCERAALDDARRDAGEAELGQVDQVSRSGRGYQVRGTVRVTPFDDADDGRFDDRPREVRFSCRWDGGVRSVRVDPVYAGRF